MTTGAGDRFRCTTSVQTCWVKRPRATVHRPDSCSSTTCPWWVIGTIGHSLPADRLRLFKQLFDISEDLPPCGRHILLNEMTEVPQFKTLGAPLTAAKSLALECTVRLPVDYRVPMLCYVVHNLHDCAPSDIKAFYERLLAAILDLPAHLRREPLAALGLRARLLCKDVGPHIYPELIAHARALPADDQGRVLKDILQVFDVKTEEEVEGQAFDGSFLMSGSLPDQHRAEVIALLARLADSLDPKRRCDKALFAIRSEVRDMAPGLQAMTRSKLSQYGRWDAFLHQWAEPRFARLHSLQSCLPALQ